MDYEQGLRAAGFVPEQGYRVLNAWPARQGAVPLWLVGVQALRTPCPPALAGTEVYKVADGKVARCRAEEVAGAEAIIIPPSGRGSEAERLVRVVATLRGEQGCPWDRRQTHAGLRRYLIEEVYEVLEAIDTQDSELLCEELGDVLLQVVFHAQLAAEEGLFSWEDVCRGIADKMIARHPHVFAPESGKQAAEVVADWEKSKFSFKKRKDILDGVPKGLPSLSLACKIQEKTARVGFDWDSVESAREKLREEWQEVREALAQNSPTRLEDECGDVLFATVNVLRHLGVEPETALRRANAKFCHRFQYVEECVRRSGKTWEETDLTELDAYWQEAKRGE
ncbi:MAG: nucleoside triphosphate pyrophosphohydrolase [Veillonellaceae bacterium]|nr:nucleoside triphosphate pyrophosphohydrolase [Veillonellaceae bacterium]